MVWWEGIRARLVSPAVSPLSYANVLDSNNINKKKRVCVCAQTDVPTALDSWIFPISSWKWDAVWWRESRRKNTCMNFNGKLVERCGQDATRHTMMQSEKYKRQSRDPVVSTVEGLDSFDPLVLAITISSYNMNTWIRVEWSTDEEAPCYLSLSVCVCVGLTQEKVMKRTK